MKGVFTVLVLIVAVVVVLGFYRSWWSFASDSSDTKVHLNVTVDKDKIQEDKTRAQETMQELAHPVKDKTAAPTGQSKVEAVSPVQPVRSQQ